MARRSRKETEYDRQKAVLDEKFKKLDALYLVGMDLTQDNEHGHALGCTAWQAAWCPVHGDCTCETTFGRYDVNGKIALCPLHGKYHYTHGRGTTVTPDHVDVESGTKPGTYKELAKERVKAAIQRKNRSSFIPPTY